MGLDRDTGAKVKQLQSAGHSWFPDEGVRIDAIIIDFSKPSDSVPNVRLPMNIAAPGVDSRVVV